MTSYMSKFLLLTLFLLVIMAYRASSLRGLAVAQMVFGALMIVFGLACIFAAHHWTSIIGFGVWVGSWVFITGILGYVGARDDSKPNKCLIGCFMGFSIFACVIAGTMFICYAVTLADYSNLKHCERKHSYNDFYDSSYYYWDPRYCYKKYNMDKETATNVAGLGSCLLIFSIVEFFLALAASICCCAGVCCNTPSGPVRSTAASNQQVMFIPQQQSQYMYPGAQGGMVLMQPSGVMSTMPQGYPAAGQQAVFVPPFQAGVPVQQPAYWAMQSESNPAGPVAVSYAGAAGTQMQNPGQVQQPPKDYERPPPYSYTQAGNAPPLTASGVNPSEAVIADV